MAAVVGLSGLPMFSHGRSMSRSPRYKRKSRMGGTHPAFFSKRNSERKPVDDDSSALKKVGAFGISVKKTQQAPDQKVSPTNTPLDENSYEVAGAAHENLPGVAISITKKFKKRIMLRQAKRHADALTSSDKIVLEDLRRGLLTRANPHDVGGTRTILEAMSDPKIRETRMMYEPLAKFLSVHERQDTTKTSRKQVLLFPTGSSMSKPQGFPPDLRLVNISVPPSQRHFNTPVEQSQVTGSTPSRLISRNSTKHGYPLFPKMSSSVFNSNSEKRGQEKATKPQPRDSSNEVQCSLAPAVSKSQQDNVGKIEVISLPSISLQTQENEMCQETEKKRTQQILQQNKEDVGRIQKHTLKNRTENGSRTYKNFRGHFQNFPRREAKPKPNTTGKSRLIGPMNKMDMITEYSSLLQNRVINYDRYIKKVSKLSLHKIDLENSGIRHYHIVRDGTTGMKHSLAMVNIYPSRLNTDSHKGNVQGKGGEQEQNFTPGRKTDTALINHRSSTLPLHDQRATAAGRGNVQSYSTPYGAKTCKTDQPHLSRVSIGEGIPGSRFDHFASGYDSVNEEFLSYDDVMRMQGNSMDRYQDAHRPNKAERRFYNWTHAPPSSRSGAHNADCYEGDLYKGYGKPLPNSREIKERLNFSYPSYDSAFAQNVGTTNCDRVRVNIPPSDERSKGVEDTSHDPDYLAISLDQSAEKSPSTERPNVTSSLSIHDVQLPNEMTVISGKVFQKGNNGNQKKGLVLGSKETMKLKECDNKELRSSIESLNITPVAITSSTAVNPNRSLTRPTYYVSQDDFAATGTDGVLQNHLTTIYKSISRAKTRGELKESPRTPTVVKGGKFSPAIKVTTKNIVKPPIASVSEENVELNQSDEHLEITSKVNEAEVKDTTLGNQLPINVEKVSDKSPTIFKSIPHTDSGTAPSSLSVIPHATLLNGSPPPTAYLLRKREDEATSAESEDGTQEFGDVISVNVIAVGANEST